MRPSGPGLGVFALLLALVAPARAQQITAVAAPAAPLVDGALAEPFWAAAAAIPLEVEWHPGDNTPATVATECRIAWDASAVYLGCEAADPAPDRVRARYRTRDEGGEDDYVAFTIDPFGDAREGYFLRVSAAGVQADALYGEETGQDFDWDAVWSAATRRHARGWTLEVAVPFSSLRLSGNGTSGEWRLAIERQHPRTVTRRFGALPLDRDNSCLLCQSLVIAGIAPGAGGQGITVQPTMTATRTRVREGDDRFADDGAALGISGRWNPSSATRVSATVNPDFSQLEADELEFEVNRRFAVSFPEKRPFFLEGRELLEGYGDLVFTRTIVDPTFGAKLTTRSGAGSAAAFVAHDRINSLILPGALGSRRTSLDAAVITAVGRGRRFLTGRSTAGLTVVAREGEGYYNRVAAADLTARAGSANRVRAVAAAAASAYPFPIDGDEAPRLTGLLANVRYDYESRRWAAEAGYRYIGRGFRADAGLLQRVDVQGPEAQLRHIFRGDADRWFNRISLAVEGQRLTDLDGRVIDGKAAVSAEYEGPFESELGIELARRRAALEAASFGLTTLEVEAGLRPSAAVRVTGELLVGGEVDSDNAREADIVRVGTGLDLRLGLGTAVRARLRHERLLAAGAEIYRTRIADLRVDYHPGLRTLIRAALQYRDIRRDPLLYGEPVQPDGSTTRGQLVFSYRAGVRTSVFVGYSGIGEESGGAPSAEQHTGFAKVAYDFTL